MPGDDELTQVVTDTVLVDDINGKTVTDISEYEDDDGYQLPRQSEMLYAISILKQYALRRDLLSSSLHTGLCTPQRHLRKENSIPRKLLMVDEMRN